MLVTAADAGATVLVEVFVVPFAVLLPFVGDTVDDEFAGGFGTTAFLPIAVIATAGAAFELEEDEEEDGVSVSVSLSLSEEPPMPLRPPVNESNCKSS